MQKTPFVPLPQPKKVTSQRMKALNRKTSELKNKLGIKGTIKEGDLINKVKSMKEKVAIMGLI